MDLSLVNQSPLDEVLRYVQPFVVTNRITMSTLGNMWPVHVSG